MQVWGRRYYNAGYGARFARWRGEKNPKPYGSYGNGAAMRVSAAGWLYTTIERTKEVAELTAEVTHNHPEAITAFLEAEDFEDSIRNAVSLGGDTDTLAAITGSIAEAFFGIPEVLKAECRNRIDVEMLGVLDAFDEALGRKNL